MSETIELSLTRLMNWLAERRGGVADGLRQDDEAHPIEPGEAEAGGRLPLAPGDRLDAATNDLGDIGALEHGQHNDAREERFDELAIAEEELEPVALVDRQVARIITDPEQRHDLRAQEEIEDEDEDQRWHVANDLDIGATDQAREEAARDAAERNQEADDGCRDRRVESEPEGHHQALAQKMRDDRPGLGVGAEEQAGHDRPVPVVDERRVGAPGEPAEECHEAGQDHQIQPAIAQLAVVTRPHEGACPSSASDRGDMSRRGPMPLALMLRSDVPDQLGSSSAHSCDLNQ